MRTATKPFEWDDAKVEVWILEKLMFLYVKMTMNFREACIHDSNTLIVYMFYQEKKKIKVKP